ncbi:MAG: hypothetical protein ACRCYY_14965 [Trueperaceae bacterium]
MNREETTHLFVRVMDLYDKYFMTLHVNNKVVAKAECSSHEEAMRLAMEAWQGYQDLMNFKAPVKDVQSRHCFLMTNKVSSKKSSSPKWSWWRKAEPVVKGKKSKVKL